jgi:hypothetical protein
MYAWLSGIKPPPAQVTRKRFGPVGGVQHLIHVGGEVGRVGGGEDVIGDELPP